MQSAITPGHSSTAAAQPLLRHLGIYQAITHTVKAARVFVHKSNSDDLRRCVFAWETELDQLGA